MSVGEKDGLPQDVKSRERAIQVSVVNFLQGALPLLQDTVVHVLVRLAQVDPAMKIARIKVVREILGWDLVTSKALVDQFFTPKESGVGKGDHKDILGENSFYQGGVMGGLSCSPVFVPQVPREVGEKVRRLEDEVRFLSQENARLKGERDSFKNSCDHLRTTMVEEEERRDRVEEKEEARLREEAAEEFHRREIQYRMVLAAVEYVQKNFSVPEGVMSRITSALT